MGNGESFVTYDRAEYLKKRRMWLNKEVREGQGIWIDRRNMLFVYRSEGNVERFVELFRKTWKQIPLRDRRKMLHFWRTVDVICAPHGYPEINFNDWTENPKVFTDEEAEASLIRQRSNLGSCGAQGFKLQFKPQAFDLMPDVVACDLIAHELAHVLQAAWGWRTEAINGEYFHTYHPGDRWPPLEMSDEELPYRDEWEYEDEVICDIMPRWGFDDDRISEWLASEVGRKYVEENQKSIEEDRAAGLLC